MRFRIPASSYPTATDAPYLQSDIAGIDVKHAVYRNIIPANALQQDRH